MSNRFLRNVIMRVLTLVVLVTGTVLFGCQQPKTEKPVETKVPAATEPEKAAAPAVERPAETKTEQPSESKSEKPAQP
jgi:hypothetical protein